MSINAVSWALGLKVDRSSTKFVLVALCNYANEFGECYPSGKQLAEDTCQDIKTVESNLARLRERGLIVDTGMRRGSTKQVVVYRIVPEAAEPVGGGDAPDMPDAAAQTAPITGELKTPVFPAKTPVFPVKDPRFSRETPPKTGDGTIKEPSRNRQGRKDSAGASDGSAGSEFVLPDWIPADAWSAFMETRKDKKARSTDYALDLIVKSLKRFQSAGHDPVEILNTSIKAGWSDVYLPKTVGTAAASGRRVPAHENFADRTYTGGKL